MDWKVLNTPLKKREGNKNNSTLLFSFLITYVIQDEYFLLYEHLFVFKV